MPTYQEFVEFTLTTGKALIVLKDTIAMLREETVGCTLWVETYGSYEITDDIATVRTLLSVA